MFRPTRRGAAAGSPGDERPGWIHVGRAYVYVAEDGRLTAQRAPTKEREQAEQLAEALREPQARAAVDAPALAEAEELFEHAEDAATPFELAAKLLRLLAEGADPTELARYAAALLTFLRQYIQEGRHRDALRLASLLVGAFLYMKKWVWIVETLRLARQAAEAVGDAAEAAWVVHDLGTLAASAGAKPLAVDLLDQAKDLYEQAGDHAAAEASSKIVAQVASSGVPTGAIVAAAVSAVVIVGAVPGFVLGGGTWYRLGDGTEEETSKPEAEIVAFAVGSEQEVPGGFDDETGYTPPEEAVAPGETLAACEPLYLYDYVQFTGMETATAWSSEMSVDGDQFAADSGEWAESENYTFGSFNYKGSGGRSSGEPVPYGRWELVVRAGDAELDRAEVTLEERC